MEAAPITTKLSNSNSNSSGYISDDISFSILSKLSVKSLYRFCCVRKSWSHLILNPTFMTLFRNNLVSKSHPLYSDDDDAACLIFNCFISPGYNSIYLISGDKFENKLKLELPPPFPTLATICVLGSAIDGILCIYRLGNPSTVLWNPATDEIIVIPPGHAKFKPAEFTTFVIPHKFGYDHVGDDYKIIQYVYYNTYSIKRRSDKFTPPNPFWEIYSRKSNSWRKTDFDMPIYRWLHNSEVYFNGVCHWLGQRNELVSFNLCNEVHFITPLPLEDNSDFEVNLIVLNGNVAIITNRKRTTTAFQISVLGEFGVKESWIRLFAVELLPCIKGPIGIGEKGNIFFVRENNELVCFDLTTGLIEEIGLRGNRAWCQMVIYKKNRHPTRERNN